MIINSSSIVINQDDAAPALQSLIDRLTPGDTLFIDKPLRYKLSRQLVVFNKPGVTIKGTPLTTLVKGYGVKFSQQALLKVDKCDYSRIEDLGVEGTTPDLFPVWNDDGVHVLESVGVIVDGVRIHGCGDSGLRICGSSAVDGPAPGFVTTRAIRVMNCEISDVYQTSTTPNGVAGYHFVNNRITQLHGSCKFASRNPGAGKLIIANNIITGASDNRQGGLELVGYVEMVIVGNIITDCVGDSAVHLHTNHSSLAPNPVLWKDAVTAGNIMLRNKGTVSVVIRDTVAPGGQLVVNANLEQK